MTGSLLGGRRDYPKEDHRPSRVISAILAIGFATALAGPSLTGCNVGPNYHPPTQPMPAHWESTPATQASNAVQEPVEIERWWTTFHDPNLDSLIHRAVAANLDLEAATERSHEARASVGIATAGLWPAANASGSYTRSGGGDVQWQSQWRAGLDAAWELDIFGGVRRSVEAANANLQAAVEDRRDVLVTLLGEVATDYILLRGQQQEILIAQQNLDVQVRNAILTRDKNKLGTGTELDNVQADAQVASTKAAIATLETSEQQTIYALSVLLGSPPTTLNNELRPRQNVPDPPAMVPVGLPSDLLRRRPDIRRAERQLAAATAQIGVATADLFPKFSLTGNIDFQASQINLLGDWNRSFWSFGPSASWSIFDAGRIASNIKVQNAVQEQALTAYRQTVLAALLEVQNVLIAFSQEQHRREALADAVDLNQRAVELSTRRYKQGVTDFLIVLDAERSLFASQDALVQSNSAVGTDAVALYKALGGGWEVGEDAPTTQPTEH
jgi:multidrug efflux system outer membrane protein